MRRLLKARHYALRANRKRLTNERRKAGTGLKKRVEAAPLEWLRSNQEAEVLLKRMDQETGPPA